jgi:lipopolysaccharide export system permease protein
VRLFLHVARRALTAFLGALAAVVLLFLAVDFAENASAFRGPGWVAAAAAIYLNRAAFVAWQTAPAAMLLAAALTASGLRRTREYTAMRALGLGPWRVAAPALAVALLAAAAVAWLGDAVASEAAGRADAIMAQRFGGGTSGPLARWQERASWFRGRGGRRVYHLRQAAEGGAFDRVTVLDLSEGFRLERRIDAERMLPGEAPGEWVLLSGTERRFLPEGVTSETFQRRAYAFGDGADAFSVLPGQPAQMRSGVLSRQIALRRALALPVAAYVLEWHNKWAWPLAGFPAGLLALALALRRDRRGHFTAALVESVAVSLAFWLAHGLCFSLGLSGRLPAAAAAWVADATFLLAGALALRRLA